MLQYPTRWLLPLCLLLLALAPARVLAQLDQVMVYGTVKDMSTAKKLDGVTVAVYKNGAKLAEVTTNASGKYEVNLDYGAEFKIMCSKPNYVGKNITIDTRNVPEEERQGGHAMNIDFTIMVEIPGVDFSILLEPYGNATYAKSSGTFEWDHEYIAKMRDAQARLLKEYENKKKREGNAEAEYAKAIQQGDNAMTAKDFKKAVDQYSTALSIKPNDPVATAKLSDANIQMEALDADRKLNEQYAALIKEGDGLFSKKDYETARTKYAAALAVKENEAHPTQRIKEIEAILADAARQAEEERKAKELLEKYNAAVAAADAAFKTDELDQAQAKYTEASGLKPEEKYPKDQLAAIATRRAELAKKAEEEQKARQLEEQYQAAIAAGDAAFNSANWDVATAKYTEASGVKPAEKYPKDQLAAIAVKKDEAAKKAEEERLAKELQERYQAAITAADAAFNGGQLDAAEAKYNEASSVKPEEKYPKDQIAAIAKKRAELAAKEEEERRARELKEEEERKARELNEQYQSLIAAADAAFNGQQWDAAIPKYNEAAALKPAEKYPKDQLAAIEAKKAELAKKEEEERKARELEERYQTAIAAADGAFNTADWTAATAKYQEASGMKPQEAYPKAQLTLIQQKIAEAEELRRQKELDDKYNAAIAAADQKFNAGDLAAAKTGYQEASGIKPAESYPKQRMSEIDAALAEQARLAEEERKQQEFEKRYADLITRADKAFDAEELSAALNDYKDAVQMKPGEAHPKSRIAAIEQKLDAAAQARAEEERLLREKQDTDKRYHDLIASADKAFTAQDLEKARAEYGSAQEVKPSEAYPAQRIKEIDDLIADRARRSEADSLAAAREAEERARKAEQDRLAAEEQARAAEEARLAAEREAEERRKREEEERLMAESSAEERRKREEEERLRREAEADLKARYNAHIVAADRAFSGNEFDLARQKYNEALGVLPDEQYPKERLAAIDKALNSKLSEEEERRRKQLEEEEAARLAEAERRRQEEADRLAREQADAEARARQDAEARARQDEAERMRREGEVALNERYAAGIAEADQLLAAKQYSEARGKYALASDIKPDETYPHTKIDQIDKLLAEMERQRLEAELAAEKARQDREAARPGINTTIDTRKEQEAEQFMRAAREREEAEKYERIKKFRSTIELKDQEVAGLAAQRRDAGVAERDQHLENILGLYEGDDARRRRNAEEMEAWRQQLAKAQAERERRAAALRAENLQSNEELRQRKAELASDRDQRHADQTQAMVRHAGDIRETEARLAERGMMRNKEARQQAEELAARQAEMQAGGDELVRQRHQVLEEEKRSLEVREAQLRNLSEESRNRTREQLESIPRDQPRAFADYNRSKLAMEYQQGVTEESYTEGNKVIIRRVVVNGNKADEYSKVIAKWGTFYFKNGQSISEAIWSKETEG